jgi:hypothetical protein
MPKYLLQASYTTEGLKGLLKEGGSSRRATVEQLARGLGGEIEAFYYAFGEHDVYAIALTIGANRIGRHKDHRAYHSRGRGRGRQEDHPLPSAGNISLDYGRPTHKRVPTALTQTEKTRPCPGFLFSEAGKPLGQVNRARDETFSSQGVVLTGSGDWKKAEIADSTELLAAYDLRRFRVPLRVIF